MISTELVKGLVKATTSAAGLRFNGDGKDGDVPGRVCARAMIVSRRGGAQMARMIRAAKNKPLHMTYYSTTPSLKKNTTSYKSEHTYISSSYVGWVFF